MGMQAQLVSNSRQGSYSNSHSKTLGLGVGVEAEVETGIATLEGN